MQRRDDEYWFNFLLLCFLIVPLEKAQGGGGGSKIFIRMIFPFQ